MNPPNGLDTGPHVKVTLDVIYRQLLEIESKVADLPTDVADHEARIRTLEKTTWAMSGIAGVVGSVLTFIVAEVLR